MNPPWRQAARLRKLEQAASTDVGLDGLEVVLSSMHPAEIPPGLERRTGAHGGPIRVRNKDGEVEPLCDVLARWRAAGCPPRPGRTRPDVPKAESHVETSTPADDHREKGPAVHLVSSPAASPRFDDLYRDPGEPIRRRGEAGFCLMADTDEGLALTRARSGGPRAFDAASFLALRRRR